MSFSELCCEKSRPDNLKFSSSADYQQSLMYNSDYGELVWENGQVVIKGGQFSTDSFINSKTGKYGTSLGFDEAVAGDADMVPWFYNFNDIVHQESTSSLLAEISGVTGNDFPSYTSFSTTQKPNNPVKDTALVAMDNNKDLPVPGEPIERQVLGGNVCEDGMDVENIRDLEPAAAVPSVCSENSGLMASNNPTYHMNGKHNDEENCDSFDDSEGDSGSTKKAGSKRNRAAEVHNLTERKRRKKINDKMQALQELLPNCNKADKASMLDEAIDYLRMLQFQIQMMSMRGQFLSPPMIPQPGLQHLHALSHFPQFTPMGIAMGYQATALNTTPGFPTCFPPQSNPPSTIWNAAQLFPMPTPMLPTILTPESAVTPVAAEIPSSKCPHMAWTNGNRC